MQVIETDIYHGPTHATASEVQADGPAGPFLGVVDCTTNTDAWFVTLTVRRRIERRQQERIGQRRWSQVSTTREKLGQRR